jgi:hypothetical protein
MVQLARSGPTSRVLFEQFSTNTYLSVAAIPGLPAPEEVRARLRVVAGVFGTGEAAFPGRGSLRSCYRERSVTASVVAEGDNYRIELDGDIAHCRVWSRPDLDLQAGARLAAEKVLICSSLANGDARALLFDLRDAPKVTGPKTQNSLAQILAAWEAAERPIAVIVSPASLQKLQLSRLAREAAPRHAEIFVDLDLAREWLGACLRGAPKAQPARRSTPAARPSPALERGSSPPAGASKPRR